MTLPSSMKAARFEEVNEPLRIEAGTEGVETADCFLGFTFFVVWVLRLRRPSATVRAHQGEHRAVGIALLLHPPGCVQRVFGPVRRTCDDPVGGQEPILGVGALCVAAGHHAKFEYLAGGLLKGERR